MVREGGFLGKQTWLSSPAKSELQENVIYMGKSGGKIMSRLSTENAIETNRKKELNDNELQKVMGYLGTLYRQAALRVDLTDHDKPQSALTGRYLDDRSFIYSIDRSLQDCSKETQLVIRKQFLEVNEKNWYLQFFSQGNFRKILLNAIREFLRIMDLL